MSISTGPVGASVTAPAPLAAGEGLQRKAVQAANAGSAQRTALNAPLTGAQAEKATTRVAAAETAVAAKPSVEHVRQSLQDINQVLATWSISVQFQIDPDFKDVIVRVVDQESGKLIRQIPSEEVVRISKAMDNLKGLLFAQAV